MFSMTESELRSVLGKNIKKYRNIKKLSQAKLAEILDITPNFISEIETGKRWISSDTLVNIADALDVEVHELLKPPQKHPDEMTAFIANYNEQALKTVSEAVIHSFESLYKHYSDENSKK